ncbi:ABC-type dipeptide/oligopeptide/nickel transport system ATPase subunit [Rhizobium sp. SG_E_25_P2]|uniref:ABC transporter ATP-binding protein n=1 Tax=Rhizobium sp. SG_E_25_P2 TaxID=2879942 RepID=UPI0024738FDA|nr:ATP-binding cassette domain-containing protein [Rhizobium sp. SG_E_25_P2]MDH6269557.1 ABC-type dipeptide/oligopeptide/nickel transport system ATPase subunit [Rhizobium sp. SG_E_25_P2]
MISVANLTAGYRSRTIITDASLTIAAGECVGLVGPSGSGKSTLLRCLTGELRPISGQARIADWTPGRDTPPPGLIGMVWQDPVGALDPLWTIGACIAEPLRAAGHSNVEVATDQALAAVRLGHLARHTRVSTLSVGQAQRVALARALAPCPKVLIADEPTSALDPTNAAAIVRMLHQASRMGTAVLVVSHNLSLLQSFCDRIVTMGEF